MNGSLNTTSFTERPSDPRGVMVDDGGYGRESYGYYDWYWHWGPFDNVEMRDDRTVLFASYMSPGTYVYEYFARATTQDDTCPSPPTPSYSTRTCSGTATVESLPCGKV